MTDGYPSAPLVAGGAQGGALETANGAYYGDVPSAGGDPGGHKRPREDDFGPDSGETKRPANGAFDGPETVYRLLCDHAIIGGIIGRGGEKINAIQRNTGAFIQALQDAPPHCLERVIVISAPRMARPGELHNDAQRALFELFEAQLQLDRSNGGPVLRMLICATQAGSLIGKSGVTIKEMKDQSGCLNIKVLQPADLPPCALASDKLLHITGDVESLRRVLDLCSTRLRDSPPKELPSHEPCQNAFPGGPPMGQGGPMGPRGPGPGYAGPTGGPGYGPPRY